MTCTLEQKRAQSKRYYTKHRAKIIARTTAYTAAHPEQRKQITVRSNRKQAAYRAAWLLEHAEHVKAYHAAWTRRNASKVRANVSERRAKKLQATPPWLTAAMRAEVLEKYKSARELGLVVDHIVPLRGRTVSGLHVPWNLQLLTAIANKKKANKHVG